MGEMCLYRQSGPDRFVGGPFLTKRIAVICETYTIGWCEGQLPRHGEV